MNEFKLIDAFLAPQTLHRPDVLLGPGDDCALIEIPANQQIAITTDTLVAGVHFPINTTPYEIGYKALAVNLSDLAAIGASPAWATLSVTLPNDDEKWIKEFACGFFELATRYQVELIGGDLTRGPLSITVQAQGLIPKGQAITRSGAQVGDLIYVSNTLGDAGLGLLLLTKKIPVTPQHREHLITKLNKPEPRVALGEILRGLATACIDLSDGLASDLGHILNRSQKGAVIFVDQLPLSDALQNSVNQEQAIALALTSGDDYELCFTVPPEKSDILGNQFTCIGKITDSGKLAYQFSDGREYQLNEHGYLHFI